MTEQIFSTGTNWACNLLTYIFWHEKSFEWPIRLSYDEINPSIKYVSLHRLRDWLWLTVVIWLLGSLPTLACNGLMPDDTNPWPLTDLVLSLKLDPKICWFGKCWWVVAKFQFSLFPISSCLLVDVYDICSWKVALENKWKMRWPRWFDCLVWRIRQMSCLEVSLAVWRGDSPWESRLYMAPRYWISTMGYIKCLNVIIPCILTRDRF